MADRLLGEDPDDPLQHVFEVVLGDREASQLLPKLEKAGKN
jgi:hypothetical protein